jgi:hypothetical protein
MCVSLARIRAGDLCLQSALSDANVEHITGGNLAVAADK